jgi:glycosyltransferase involved in cell wall biosynthesis
MSESIRKYKIGILATHPIQYYVPWYRELARYPEVELEVFYCQAQTPEGQARAGFGVSFEWDIPLLAGYNYRFLNNKSRHPNVYTFWGSNTPEIKEIISRGAYDAFIVQGWYVLSFWQAIIACWKTGAPLFVRGDSNLELCTSVIKKGIKYLFYRWFIPKFDAYLVVGKRNEEYYLHYGARRAKMFFSPHCVDNDYFSHSCDILKPQREQLRQRLGLPADALVFLFVGKLIARKRPEDFLGALELAASKAANIYGLIVGDGPLRSELEAFSTKHNLPVVFAGFVNQRSLPEAYAASDCLVLTSKYRETWGLVVNEAMASKLPVIVSNEAGCQPDLVYPGSTGEAFPSGDTKRLVDIFIDFASRRAHLEEMGKKSFQLIQRYSAGQAAKAVLAALDVIAGNKKSISAK